MTHIGLLNDQKPGLAGCGHISSFKLATVEVLVKTTYNPPKEMTVKAFTVFTESWGIPAICISLQLVLESLCSVMSKMLSHSKVGIKDALRENSNSRQTAGFVLSPVTDVGRVLAFFSCSLRWSLDTAVSGFFSSDGVADLCREPALLPRLLPGCGLTLTCVGNDRESMFSVHDLSAPQQATELHIQVRPPVRAQCHVPRMESHLPGRAPSR